MQPNVRTLVENQDPGSELKSHRISQDTIDPRSWDVLCLKCGGVCSRSSRHGLVDRLRGWFGWYPWRCQTCQARRYAYRRT